MKYIATFLILFALIGCSDEYNPEIGYNYDEVQQIITETSRVDTIYISSSKNDTVVIKESKIDTLLISTTDTVLNVVRDTQFVYNRDTIVKFDTVIVSNKDTIVRKDTIVKSHVDTLLISKVDTLYMEEPVVKDRPIIKDTTLNDTADGVINMYPVFWIKGVDNDTIIYKIPQMLSAEETYVSWKCTSPLYMQLYYDDPYGLFPNVAIITGDSKVRYTDNSWYYKIGNETYSFSSVFATTKGSVGYGSHTINNSGSISNVPSKNGILLQDLSVVEIGGLCATIREHK